jgi:hypothetical protein
VHIHIIKNKRNLGNGEMASWVIAVAPLPEDLGPAQITTACNSSSRGFNTLFWPPWVLHTCDIQIVMQKKTHSYIYIYTYICVCVCVCVKLYAFLLLIFKFKFNYKSRKAGLVPEPVTLPRKAEKEAETILRMPGVACCQPIFKFQERPCLKGIRWLESDRQNTWHPLLAFTHMHTCICILNWAPQPGPTEWSSILNPCLFHSFLKQHR